MSYTIIYDRRFLKTTRGIIPVVLVGSNNCTTITFDSRNRRREVRERSWTPTRSEWIEAEPETILQAVAAYEPGHEMFMHHGKWIYSEDAARWYANGIKAAATLEEYKRANYEQALTCELICYHKDKYAPERELWGVCNTTAELEQWLDQAMPRKAELEKDGKYSVYVSISFMGEKPLAAPPAAAIQSEPVVAKKGTRDYVQSFEKDRSLSFTQDIRKAYVFASPEDAREKMGNHWKLRFVKQSAVKKQKHYVLQLEGGYMGGNYVVKKTPCNLHYTCKREYARNFPSRSAAVHYAKRIFNAIIKTRLENIVLIDLDTGANETLLRGELAPETNA